MAPPWVVHCDGSAVPNPGRMGLGAVLQAPDGRRQLLSRVAAGSGCNNEAELRAFIAALQELQAQGASAFVAYSDSRLLVDQLALATPGPVARLTPLFDEARLLRQTFEEVSVRWIPGHRNADADALARAALGMPPRPPAQARSRRR